MSSKAQQDHSGSQQTSDVRTAPPIADEDTQQARATEDLGVYQTIKRNPIVVLCTLYGNIGALMYGFDNISLSLALDMQPFV